MNAFNPTQFRAQFPALADAGVYLDSAATALKPQAVIDATHQFYCLSAGNVHRSQFAQAQRLTAQYEAARAKAARLLNAPDEKSIVWTRGTTEAINMVAQCYARPRLRPGDEIIVSVAEHHANLVPWLMVAQQTGAQVIKLPLNDRRLPDVERLPELITSRSRILALGQMSNVTGGCPDLASAISAAHAAGMVVMVDGAQGAVHFPADLQQLDIDFYAFSAHKLYGPTGIGVLYGKPELLEAMSPWLGGGKMIRDVSFEGFTTQSAPWKLEAGTPNVAGVVGLSAALEWLSDIDIEQAENWSRGLATLAEDALAKRPGFRSFRCQDSSLLAFDFVGVHHGDMVTLLAEYGIALRAGQHCAQPLLAELGVTGTLRASFAPYNTQHDVDALVNAIDRALELLVD
ncbi:cysteine desulfurase CsdA [Salmonella enterica]|uniref:cysteine desulfurase n=2 Tax=Salmonella enterica TaxID=28901 RepID=A0A625Z7G8_SALER|nr:cysteine desulfurase CsdA [Salmonella enterica]ECS5456349.1 cysteine desulfurase CsdA [Salmonella enterica subsp. enterica serovar Berta]ECS7315010.1 cysteine desulfurase CsdA [Salmonella enterica subsp. enterica serovar Miami str. CFSAN000579]EDN5013467.1 cysteine desulfurase CsdA [Salmonella enterica subsp. enterica serovar Javiana]EED8330923.1 cysteine desulfurase CsdA [Salmonella enterica subsp. enterica serovar Thompson]HAA1151145.1 cysteine desulfurase CsdA [Salmonella enterica subsp.